MLIIKAVLISEALKVMRLVCGVRHSALRAYAIGRLSGKQESMLFIQISHI
jgi:hypothetical protein